MIEVSITTVYSEVYFDYFPCFPVFFQFFSPSFVKRRQSFTLVCLFWLSMFLRTNSYIFRCRHCQLYGCKMAASKVKLASLWRHCDIMTRHNWHVISPITLCSHLYFVQVLPLVQSLCTPPPPCPRLRNWKKSPGRIGLTCYKFCFVMILFNITTTTRLLRRISIWIFLAKSSSF